MTSCDLFVMYRTYIAIFSSLIIIVLWLENVMSRCSHACMIITSVYKLTMTLHVCDHIKYNIIQIPIMVYNIIHINIYTSFNACHIDAQ